MSEKSSNVVWHKALVTREDRQRRNHHKSVVLWFTGLSASGKSTLAHAVEKRLHDDGCNTFVLDGDNVRHGLCSDLGFSLEDRAENLRRIGEVAKLMIEAGTIVLTAFISPLRQDRERVRSLFPHGDFLEIYCDASIEVCESRDPKGLYRRARAGEIPDFTGISSPYEAPINPELRCNTGEDPVEENVEQVLEMLRKRGIISG
ncbi:MAG: adenylyl-sulfate kinase [Gammaproteobacteria bacterium]|nr:MAG: adenylyl-sulfate kinase [Gammaproteobacteria bacterium]